MLGRRALDLVIFSATFQDMLDVHLVKALRTQKADVLMLPASPRAKAGSPIPQEAAISAEGRDEAGGGPKLLALIKVALRARYGLKPADLQLCNVGLSLATREAAVDGLPMPLTPKEFAVLELLFLRRNTVLSKDAFLDHLYGDTSERQSAAIVDVFICKLRRKLAQAGAQATIATVWGRGYMVRAEDRDRPPITPSPVAPSELRRAPRTLVQA